MTEEQKDILITKMLDAPATLTNEELAVILDDAELKDIYDMSADVSSAYIHQTEVDMVEEWSRLSIRLFPRRFRIRRILYVAAALIGIALVSGLVARMIINSPSTDRQTIITKVDRPIKSVEAPDSYGIHEDNTERTSGEASSPITANPIDAQHKRHVAKSKIYKQPRSEKKVVEIDIDEYLRIQQAKIDNEIALQTAAILAEEYTDMLLNYDVTGVYDNSMAATIGNVTMQ